MMNKCYIFPILGTAIILLLSSSCKPASPGTTTATPAEIKEQLSSLEAPLTLVHVWATWCGPCREEFPELVRIIHDFQPLEVVLISADDPAEAVTAEAFLAEHNSPVGSLITTELNQEFMEAISPNWEGALPATFFFQSGKIVREWEGKRTYEQFAETINELL